MESRYFVIYPETIQGKEVHQKVLEYLNVKQAVNDYVRLGGLVDKNIIFAVEQPVSIRINNATIDFSEPKEVTVETELKDKAD